MKKAIELPDTTFRALKVGDDVRSLLLAFLQSKKFEPRHLVSYTEVRIFEQALSHYPKAAIA
jgi:hypothetical protein